jgi:putative DNA methylase
MRSELATRNIGRGTNALASSVILVCRPRAQSAALANRKEFLAGLKAELPDALRRLQQGNIAPVDLAQAAIGPGVAVFSRYSKVVEADGSAMSVRTALGIINQVLDETLAQQEGDFDSDTRWAVAWFDQFAMKPGEYGVAETLSKAKNSAVNALVEAGIIEARSGRVRLLAREELAADWDPAADRRLTVWEVTQHLIRALETGGESAAAELVGRVGGIAETARELAYRLYNICERRRWANEAVSYNGLVVAWPAILRVAAEQPGGAVQLSLGG